MLLAIAALVFDLSNDSIVTFTIPSSGIGKASGPDQLSPVYLDHLWPGLNH
jgi:hypothetical protein